MPSIKSSIGNPRQISLDDACSLVTQTTTEKDELGQPILKENLFQIFCSKLSITRSEFSSAGVLGHKPELMLVVDSDSYDREKKVIYEEKRYNIYKTFQRVDGFTELYCELTINDKN
jgi:hypothetical protein